MNILKKILISAFAVTSLGAFSFLAVSCDEGPEAPPKSNAACTEHVDANKNGECDKCGADVKVPCDEHYDNDEDNICDNEDCLAVIKQPITYTVTVKDESGNPVAGVKVKLIKEYKGGGRNTVVEALTDTQGKISGTIIPDFYVIEASELPRGWYLNENQTKMEISENSSALILNAVDGNPEGTEDDPHFLGDEPFVEPFDANETLYFFVKGQIYVEITTPGVSLTYDGNTYTTESGKISVLLAAPETSNGRTMFSVSNTKAEENEITIVPVAIPGSSGNPFHCELGESVSATVVKDDTVYYEWTAAKAGTFTISTETEKNYIFMTNLTNSHTTATTDGNVAEGLDSIEITLAEGDTVRIAVSYRFADKDTQESAVVVFIATFAEA